MIARAEEQQGQEPGEQGQAGAGGELRLEHAAELALALQLTRFAEVVHDAAQELAPHQLAAYTHRLALAVSAFYRDCRVLRDEGAAGGGAEGEPTRRSRLALCRATRDVLGQSLHLLGVQAMERI